MSSSACVWIGLAQDRGAAEHLRIAPSCGSCKTCVNYALWARPARPRGAPRAGVQRVVDQLVAVRAEDLAARGAPQPARAAADGALLRPREGAFAHGHRAEGLREGGDPWGERDHRTGVGASHEAHLWW